MFRTVNSARNWKVSLGCNLCDSAREVPDLEKLARINRAAVEHIIAIDMRQIDRRQVQPRPGNDAGLDSNVVKMLLFEAGGGLDLDQTPSVIATALQNIHTHEHTAVLEGAFKDCWNSRLATSSRVVRIALSSPPEPSTSTPPGNNWRASMPTSRPCSMIA